MRRGAGCTAKLAAAALAGVAFAQDPAPQPPRQAQQPPRQQAPEEPPVSAADRALAEQALRALAARHRDVAVLTAHYVQRRHTELLAEPLVTEGELAFRREPPVVVFRTAGPRAAVVRLDERVYEVHRPTRRRLERFALAGPELPRALFAALGGELDRLQREFDVVAFERLPATVPAGAPAAGREGEPPQPARERCRIGLAPRDATLRERLHRLVLVVGAADGRLDSVSYRDPEGDLVAIELRDVVLDPEHPLPFTIDVPAGTQVLEHAPPPGDR